MSIRPLVPQRNYLFEDDNIRYLAGRFLIQKIIESVHGYMDWDRLGTTSKGKPYYLSGPSFSISHSERIICGVYADSDIGIDVECIREIDIDQYRKALSEQEYDLIRSSEDSLSTFYRIWTRKEAILKAEGSGLGIGPDELDTSSGESVCFRDCVFFLTELCLCENYTAHVAFSRPHKMLIRNLSQ